MTSIFPLLNIRRIQDLYQPRQISGFDLFIAPAALLQGIRTRNQDSERWDVSRGHQDKTLLRDLHLSQEPRTNICSRDAMSTLIGCMWYMWYSKRWRAGVPACSGALTDLSDWLLYNQHDSLAVQSQSLAN